MKGREGKGRERKWREGRKIEKYLRLISVWALFSVLYIFHSRTCCFFSRVYLSHVRQLFKSLFLIEIHYSLLSLRIIRYRCTYSSIHPSICRFSPNNLNKLCVGEIKRREHDKSGTRWNQKLESCSSRGQVRRFLFVFL